MHLQKTLIRKIFRIFRI